MGSLIFLQPPPPPTSYPPSPKESQTVSSPSESATFPCKLSVQSEWGGGGAQTSSMAELLEYLHNKMR